MPLGIIILGIFAIIGGIFSLFWGFGLSGIGGVSWLTGLLFSQGLQSWGGSAFWAGLWSIVVGTVQIITGIGLFARQKWAWMLALIAAALALITPLVALFGGNLWALWGLIIPGIIFYYLLADSDVKRAFGRV
jgi:hypothetical protein